MGNFNSPMKSMTWEEDYTDLNAGTIVSTTWYEGTSYAGVGRLMAVGVFFDTTLDTGEIRVTTDGNAHILLKTNMTSLLSMFNGVVTTNHLQFPFSLEFQTSLVVEGRRDGDTNDIELFSAYGILSKEFKREIIPAGQPVPDQAGNPRPKTYPFDIMLVWFEGSSGISNKVEFPKPEKLDLSAGKLWKPAGFGLTVNGPRYTFEQSAETKTISQNINGKKYAIDVISGEVQTDSVPYLIDNDDFWERFTDDEQEALVSHTNPKAQAFLYQIRIRPRINLRWTKLITAVSAIESGGIIAAGRAAEILAV